MSLIDDKNLAVSFAMEVYSLIMFSEVVNF
ncbi:hypothetical protein NC651_007157 [Populus alba x Populus x berolinensis]|nr:hypothetical protein NC651_007157 [Populus alba x Populus x berolinensis]